ncbi:hypothetical protein ACOMHN_032181 [Nucella lapillus]
MATDAARKEPYIGEKTKFKRNGYGVYVYENQYFRYEGEWKNGKKQGHGKLTMKDGTYYEGQFVNGEINGHGFKYFSGPHCKYTGQFLNGEMHGHGVMQYADESVYEGQWVKNKKQGFGILRTSTKAIYEGMFSSHHRNGEGSQTYEGKHILSNGDRYEGYWVRDKRHGHGELYCADGTLYVGQFADDMYHGEGKMQHASGMLYMGQWLHGFPTRLATKLIIIVEESPLTIRQGQPFKVIVKCQDDDGNDVLEDQGREIQVTAGFKYFPPKQGSVLFDMIEDVEEKPIPTPFGYEVVSYPLTDQLSEEEVVEEDKGDKRAKDNDGEDKGEGEGGEGEGIPEVAEGVEGQEEEAMKEQPPAGPREEEAPPLPRQQGQGRNKQQPKPSATQRTITPVEATPLPPPVSTKRTEGGNVEWGNLQLSPPPPLYRPFVAMDEEKKTSKKMSMKDKFGQHIVSVVEPPQEVADATASMTTPIRERSLSQASRAEKRKISHWGRKVSELKADNDRIKKLSINEKRGSQIKLGDSKEKSSTVADEKFARTGDYVLMVHDVTMPPFLGKQLEPAFLLLKLKRPKKIIVKKHKWDTQRHIVAAMQSRIYNSIPNP